MERWIFHEGICSRTEDRVLLRSKVTHTTLGNFNCSNKSDASYMFFLHLLRLDEVLIPELKNYG